MPRHKKGTVVRAYTKEELGEDLWTKNSSDEFVVPNGYLYIIERFIPTSHYDNEHDADAYECRSIATGELIQLFPHEITTTKEQRNANRTGTEA